MAASINDKATKSYSFLSKSLSSGISSVDTTIPLNNVTSIPTDTAVHFVIDRVDSNGNRTPSARELCKGVVSGGNLINCTRGLHGTTAQSHSSGAVVEFTASAVGWNELIDAFIGEHSQVDGTHSTTLITARTEDTAPDGSADFVLTYDNSGSALKKVKPDNLVRNNTQISTGWISSVLPSVSSVTNNGNRSQDVTFGSSVASYLTPGMRVRGLRTSSAPTTVFSLDGSNDYYNKTTPNGFSFTDDATISAWVRLSSYAAGTIVSKYNGTSGFILDVKSTGQVAFTGYNGGAANYSYVQTYQSIPLNKWVHITAQLDMSSFTATTTTSYIMLDGVDVPCTVARGGTNPTALVQAGNLEIGGHNGGSQPFPGYITDVMIFNAKVTQATIRGYMYQKPTGSETSLISAYSNGSTTDLNTGNANNLTAQNGATTSTAYMPYGVDGTGTPVGTYDYGIVTKVATTTATIQFPEGSGFPTSGGVSAVDLSTVKCPYGFPAAEGRWKLSSIYRNAAAVASNATYAAWTTSWKLNVPVGQFKVGWMGDIYNNSTTAVVFNVGDSNISGKSTTTADLSLACRALPSAATSASFEFWKQTFVNLTAATDYTMYTIGATTAAGVDGTLSNTEIFALPDHL